MSITDVFYMRQAQLGVCVLSLGRDGSVIGLARPAGNLQPGEGVCWFFPPPPPMCFFTLVAQ